MSSSTTYAASPASRSGARPRGGAPLAIVFVTVFLDLVGFGIVIPLLPLYAERFGAGPVAVTWLLAVYSLMQFFFAPWWGRLSDRVGRRPVLLVGLFGSAASYLAFGVAGSLAALFVARAVGGFMGANVGVAQAYVADVTSPEERARGMGMIGAAFGLGFILGPALGGVLARFGPATPFLGAAALTLVNALVAVRRLPESLPPDARGAEAGTSALADRVHALVRAVRSPRLAALFAVSFLATLALATFEGTLSLWADRRWQLSPAGVAYTFAYVGVVATVVQGALVGRVVRRLGERRTATTGAAVLAVGLAGVPLAPDVTTLALALAAFAFGQGMVTPAVSAMISRSAGPREQGRLLGALQSLSALGRVAGPVWGGIAFARLGIAAPSLSAAVLAAAALVALLAAGRSLATEAP